jgi:uncharacterized protein YbaR (Trm112 family)
MPVKEATTKKIVTQDTAVVIDGVLCCPQCQGSDLSYMEWVPVEYDVLRVEGDTLVVDMDSQDFDADGAEPDSLYCQDCEETLRVPAHIKATEFEKDPADKMEELAERILGRGI